MTEERKESLLTAVEGRDLAIGIQISASVGPNRQVVLTSGVPIDMPLDRVNAYVDKMFGVIDRQNDRGMLEQAKLALENAERDLKTSVKQMEHMRNGFIQQHYAGNRRGEWKANGTEKAKLDQFETSQVHLRTVVIPKLQRDIGELEKRLGGT